MFLAREREGVEMQPPDAHIKDAAGSILVGGFIWILLRFSHDIRESTGILRYVHAPKLLLWMCGVPNSWNGVDIPVTFFQLGFLLSCLIVAAMSITMDVNSIKYLTIKWWLLATPVFFVTILEIVLRTIQWWRSR